MVIKKPKEFTPEDIKEIRKKLQLTQRMFSLILGVSSKTIEAWERGTNRPNGSARRLLTIYSQHPNIALSEMIENNKYENIQVNKS